jgi:hypothetical protein
LSIRGLSGEGLMGGLLVWLYEMGS